MNPLIQQFNTALPFPSVFPDNFKAQFPSGCDYFSFRNLAHFKHTVSKLTQRKDDYCDISYEEAVRKLIKGESDFDHVEQASIREEVRSNLHRRGLITEEVYEAYRYTVDGTTVTVDVGKFAAGEPDCVMSPARQYVDFFYELYVNVSYPYTISNTVIRTNCAKMLAAIEELERQHIFIKVAMVLPIDSPAPGRNFFSDLPLFSHKEAKSVDTMSSVINDKLLRKFYFAILEDYYGDTLYQSYGTAVTMDGSFNIGGKFDPVDFFINIMKYATEQ